MADPFGKPKKLPPNIQQGAPRINVGQVANEIKTKGSSPNYNKLNLNLKKTLINNLKNIQKNGSSDEKNYINSFFKNFYKIDQKKNEKERDNLIKEKDFNNIVSNAGSSSSSSSSHNNKDTPKYTKEDFAQLRQREQKKIVNKLTKPYRQPTRIETTEEKNKKAEEAAARAVARAAENAKLTEQLKLKAAEKRKQEIAAAAKVNSKAAAATTAASATPASATPPQSAAVTELPLSPAAASATPASATSLPPQLAAATQPPPSAPVAAPQPPPPLPVAAPQPPPAKSPSLPPPSTAKSPSLPPPAPPSQQTAPPSPTSQSAAPSPSSSQSASTSSAKSPPLSSQSASPSPPPPSLSPSAASAPQPEAEAPIKYYKKLELPKDLDTKGYRNEIVKEMKEKNFTINYKSFKKYSTSNINPDTVECIVYCKNKKNKKFTKCGFKNTHIKLKEENYNDVLKINENKKNKLENIPKTFTICTKHFKEFLGIKMKYSKSINKIIMKAAKEFEKDNFVCGNDFLDISQFLPYYNFDNELANVIVDDNNKMKIIAKRKIKEGEELILFLPN